MIARRFCVITILSFLPIWAVAQSVQAEPGKPTREYCVYWQSRVDSSVPVKQRPTFANDYPVSAASGKEKKETANTDSAIDPDGIRSLSDQQATDAIDCLLELQGNKHLARFANYTQPSLSTFFAPASAELGALYYVSYIYTQKWDHAGAVALSGEGAGTTKSFVYVTSPGAVSKAYDAYRAWFKRVKEIGLRQARENNIDPLEGTGMQWYGSGLQY